MNKNNKIKIPNKEKQHGEIAEFYLKSTNSQTLENSRIK